MLDLTEIWYTCTLGEYLGVFFSFFENFHFWARGTRFLAQNGPKSSGQPTEPKNCWIWLIFGTLVPWVNTWGCFFFSFYENFHFWARGTRFGLKWTKIFGAAYTAQKLLVPVEVWYTRSLCEYLIVFF